ncbi:hypothetical protein DL93DRAFT_2165418 [Clavulina sp. PMI_390]|nr:hypothetical protein DL93DRAFT_2165418 [Clavulina sp. PMI_390]
MKKFFRPSKPKGNELSPTPLALPPETPIHAAHAQQANGNAAYSQRPSELTNAPNGGQDRSGWVVVDPSSDGSSAGERTWSSTDAPPPMAPPPNPGRTRVDSKPSSISSLSLQAQAVLHATTNATAGIAAAVAAPVSAGAPPPQALQSQTNPSLMSSAPPTPASSAPASAIRTSPKSPPPLSAVNTSRQPSSQPQRSPSTKQSTKDSSTGKRRSGQIFPWADQRIPQHTNSTNTTSPSVSRSGTLSEQHQQSHHRPSPLHSQPNPNSIIAPLVSSPDPRPTSTYSTDTTATRDMLDSAHVMTPQHYHHPSPPMQVQQQQQPTIAKKEEKEQGTRRHLADLFFASSHKDAASNKSKHPSFDVEVTVRK